MKIKQKQTSKFLEALREATRNYNEGNYNQAAFIAGNIIKKQPGNSGALHLLGLTSERSGKYQDALNYLKRALLFDPENAEIHNAFGISLIAKKQYDDAIRCFQKALRIKPDLAEAYFNLGLAHQDTGKLDDAIRYFRDAIRITPDFTKAHWNLAHLLLLQGDFREGWKEYEWRWKTEDFIANQSGLPHPLWDGSDIAGKTILLQAEQGFGDTIQFIRYAPLVSQRCAKVIVGCHKVIKSLMQSVGNVNEVIAYGEKLPEFDVRCRLLSLPAIFETNLETIPSKAPYISADRNFSEKWRKKLQNDGPALKAGIAWAGSKEHKRDHDRSCPPELLLPLFDIDNIAFYSLQKGEAFEETKHFTAFKNFNDYTADIQDFSDTAGIIENLDLVITVDTSVAHLAGALGKPVWTLLPFIPDWRWMLNREDSPWYPTMKLFRQPSEGDWRGIIVKLKEGLQSLGKSFSFNN
jgi:tetratricopeptide (TPR) repeat protein